MSERPQKFRRIDTTLEARATHEASNRHRLDSVSTTKMFYIYMHACKNLWSFFLHLFETSYCCAKVHITRDFNYSAKSKHRHEGTRVTRAVTAPGVLSD